LIFDQAKDSCRVIGSVKRAKQFTNGLLRYLSEFSPFKYIARSYRAIQVAVNINPYTSNAYGKEKKLSLIFHLRSFNNDYYKSLIGS